MTTTLDCGGRTLDLSRPCVMGILNVTPDSFSDGGVFVGADQALAHARQMEADGAAIIDVGGESTRPGSRGVSVDEELSRVIPVLEALHGEVSVPLSVDTSKPAVMRAAVDAGAGLINDVMALRRDGALAAARDLGVPVCLMHMQGTPETMQDKPSYQHVVKEVVAFLLERVEAAEAAGIERCNLMLDPGFGFGKTDPHNAELLKGLPKLVGHGLPVLAGLSRKSLVGRVLGRAMEERLAGSVALATMATMHGARIIRAHDVRETVDAVRLVNYVMAAQGA
ncbi:dihydropteroate synthase [Spiribacter salinus]|uniref:dihydropteroate synthase n=1 Tax=Spiribacter salinus TaxID=1335746 RepID=UPI001C9432E3|nr:dihydropteroate synthase [Spiribacter salinus]MBY5267936.1 dihydropteroate synthase [Spiribacter salinus]MDR9413719.1 dihydropteroate synthase [Spiribacter sp.]MDR9454168.1 dihydropteroate synthase [Spiribacter sp.]